MIDHTSVGKNAIAHATPIASGRGPELGKGVIMAVVTEPMVLIEDTEGKRFWWIASQTEVIE